MTTPTLFGPDLPDGFAYREDAFAIDEEAGLLARMAEVPFTTFEMHGVAARRRVAFFGQTDDDAGDARPLPEWLLPVRARVADWAALPAAAFVMGLVLEYSPGSAIGWHRDRPAAAAHARKRRWYRRRRRGRRPSGRRG